MPVNSFDHYPMSWKPQKPADRTPLYKSLANQLEDAILSGSITPNTLLPPQRELADYLDVNLSTITRAFKICEQKGYIYAVTGKGTFVSPNALLYRSSDTAPSSGGINLYKIEPFHETDTYTQKAIADIIKRPTFGNLLSYQTSKTLTYHKTSGCKYLNAFGISVTPDCLLITAGSQNALAITLLSLFQAGDKIAVDEFTYHHFKMLANYLRISLIPVGCDNAGMLPKKLQTICISNHIKGIYLMPSCSNPTTIQIPLSRRRELCNVIQRNHLLIIEDDSYRFLSDPDLPSFHSLIPEHTIYICSTSKSLCAGIRLAYMAYPKSLKNDIYNGYKSTNLYLSSIDAEIISELINSEACWDIIKDKKKQLLERNELYNQIFQDDIENCNPYSFYRWLKTGLSKKEVMQKLNSSQIHVMEADLFNAGTQSAENYIRVSLTSVTSITRLKSYLELLKTQVRL